MDYRGYNEIEVPEFLNDKIREQQDEQEKQERMERRIRREQIRRKKVQKTRIKIAIIAVITAAGLTIGGNVIANAKEGYDVIKAASSYTTAVNDNTHRTQDMKNYYYDNSGVARQITQQYKNNPNLDMDLLIYSCYMAYDYQTINQMNQLVSLLGLSNTFYEYIEKIGLAVYDEVELDPSQIISKNGFTYAKINDEYILVAEDHEITVFNAKKSLNNYKKAMNEKLLNAKEENAKLGGR